MKKYLTAIFVMLFAFGGARADTCDAYFKTGNAPDADYTIYFDNDRDSLSTECKNFVRGQLAQIQADNCTRVIIVASASKTGTFAYNDKLSNRRMEYVYDLMPYIDQNKVFKVPAGENRDTFMFPNINAQASERAVRVFLDKSVCTIPQDDADKGGDDDNGEFSALILKIRGLKADFDKSITAAGLKQSVWKDENGNFNTSRLISDSVAGVVLGTAGGVITSKVIKKNQVSNGFDDIKCTIGDQVVADWDDQFRVGVQ